VSYLKLRFDVPRDRADELNRALEAQGALSVTWENAGADEYFEVAHPQDPDWSRVRLTGLFGGDCEPAAIAERVNRTLGTRLIPQVKTLADQDWERAWMSRLAPRRYHGNLWVCPSWVDPPDPQATTLLIDPGLAFGTGDHPTTALCLDWIGEASWSGETVLDYGCGSGILAIACLLKGASRAVGVDVDARALSASVLNAERNGVAAGYEGRTPRELADDLRAEVVVANILSNVLIELSEVLTRAVCPGGRLLLTGILADHAERVRAVFAPAFELEARRREGWCLLLGRKR